jgi:dipeptidyl aminopeptidase/acylaminoacyl peptidase
VTGSPSCRRFGRHFRVLIASLPALSIGYGPASAHDGAAIPPAISDLVEAVDIGGLSASPDGDHIAFRTVQASLDRNSHLQTWHIVRIESGEGRQGGGGDPIYVDPGIVATTPSIWSPASEAIFFRALADGAIGLRRMPLDGSGAQTIFVGDGDVESLQLTRDASGLDIWLGPSRTAIRRAEEAEHESGILIDETVDLAQNLFRGGWVEGRMATQRLTGNWFRRGGLLIDEPQRRYRLNFSTLDAVSPLPDQGEERQDETSASVARASDGAVATISRTDTGSHLSVRLTGAADAVPCPRRLCALGRVEAAVWRPGRRQLLVTLADLHHRQTIHIWDLDRQATWRLVSGNGLLGGGDQLSPCALTTRYALCVAAGPTSPPLLERIDLDNGRREILYDPNRSLRSRQWPAAELLSWSGDGQDFTGILLRPAASDRPLPLVINYYRCQGFLRGGIGDEIPFAPLALAGFAVLCVNAPSLQGEHDARSTYRTGLSGVRAGIELLAERGLVDRRRVGMAGLSFGSEVTMWTAMNSDLLAAASIASVQLEPAYYWFNAVRGRDHPEIMRSSWGLGSPDEDIAGWQAVSPALNAGRIHAPLLMQLPEQEARYVIELYARLSNSATPVELYAFPDEPHIKIQPRHKLAAYARNLDWFRFWLQGHNDPDPSKHDQYRRWTALLERRASAGGSPPPPA